MKAIKKPIPITVQVFDPQQHPWPLNVHVRNMRSIGAAPAYLVWNVQHKIYIPVEPGDYVNVTNADDTFPIKPDVFMATYDVVADADGGETLALFGGLTADDLMRVVWQWERLEASPEQTDIVIKLGKLRAQLQLATAPAPDTTLEASHQAGDSDR